MPIDSKSYFAGNKDYMNATDYSSKLANVRSDYAEKTEKLRTTFKENENNLEKVHENDKNHQQTGNDSSYK